SALRPSALRASTLLLAPAGGLVHGGGDLERGGRAGAQRGIDRLAARGVVGAGGGAAGLLRRAGGLEVGGAAVGLDPLRLAGRGEAAEGHRLAAEVDLHGGIELQVGVELLGGARALRGDVAE